MSMSSPARRRSTLPSCGRRRSPMSMPARIFSRVITGSTIAGAIASTSCSTPSMRNRTRARLPWGSMCMSEAPCFSARPISVFSRLTVGASEASSRSRPSSTELRPGPGAASLSRPRRAFSTSNCSSLASRSSQGSCPWLSHSLTSRSSGAWVANTQRPSGRSMGSQPRSSRKSSGNSSTPSGGCQSAAKRAGSTGAPSSRLKMPGSESADRLPMFTRICSSRPPYFCW